MRWVTLLLLSGCALFRTPDPRLSDAYEDARHRFPVGSVVRMRSGGKPMTVRQVVDGSPRGDPPTVCCSWFDPAAAETFRGQAQQDDCFAPELLELSSPAQ